MCIHVKWPETNKLARAKPNWHQLGSAKKLQREHGKMRPIGRQFGTKLILNWEFRAISPRSLPKPISKH